MLPSLPPAPGGEEALDGGLGVVEHGVGGGGRAGWLGLGGHGCWEVGRR